jgi:hypothetical protein
MRSAAMRDLDLPVIGGRQIAVTCRVLALCLAMKRRRMADGTAA